MGTKLHVLFQQNQKYDSGKSRGSAARLFEICEALEVSLASMIDRKLKTQPTVADSSRNGQYLSASVIKLRDFFSSNLTGPSALTPWAVPS
jgi:hypothetical protein